MAPQTGFIPRGHNVVTLRVTSYRDRCLKGILNGALFNGNRMFGSAIELLCQLEAAMDQVKLPQRNEGIRVFRATEQLAREETGLMAEEKTPAIASFQISIMFRQNATWQGYLFWVDQGMEAHFRSVLELLKLIDNALSNEG